MGNAGAREAAAASSVAEQQAEGKPTGAGSSAGAPEAATPPVFLASEPTTLEESAPPPPPQAAPRSEGKIEAAWQAIADYKISRTLGQGAYGKVKLATNVNNGHHVAVKVIDRSKLVDRPQGTQQLAREINTMKILRHENVIRLYEVIHTPTKIFMVMEYASGGDLLAYLNANGRLSEARAAALFGGMIEGLHFCHKLGVCHRDLKLENLLLVDDTVKIADFGMAALAPPASFCKTLCGSPDYAAPEILHEVAHYDGELADAWSSGVILYALLCRRLPFQAQQGDIQALFHSIKTGDFSIPAHVGELPADLIRRLLETEPSRRWSVGQSRMHGWFKQPRNGSSAKAGIRAVVSMDVPRSQASLASAFASPPAADDTPEHRRNPPTDALFRASSQEPHAGLSDEGAKRHAPEVDASFSAVKLVNSR